MAVNNYFTLLPANCDCFLGLNQVILNEVVKRDRQSLITIEVSSITELICFAKGAEPFL